MLFDVILKLKSNTFKKQFKKRFFTELSYTFLRYITQLFWSIWTIF